MKMIKTFRRELLAPAGSYEALIAAVYAGADAVYLAGKAFGARQYADNFDREEIIKAITFAHLHRVKVFVTVNTLIDDSEMTALAEYLLFLHNNFADGIIVQDLGVIRLAKHLVPDLPLHASTQMTVTNSLGVKFAREAGTERVVLARELSLKEITAACDQKTEIETFVHGALCICYSGQCLLSSFIGGRSGNRGCCAQPCRLPYTLVNESDKPMLVNKDAGQYLLSPRDFNTLDTLQDLLRAGVTSFKIEGRMKRPEYVAVVTDIYRRALDNAAEGNFVVSQQDKNNIRQIFNRDFTTAYLYNRPGRMLMSDKKPNNRGVLIGRLTEISKENRGIVYGQLKLEQELHTGDGLEFWVSVGGRSGTTVETIELNGKPVNQAPAHSIVRIPVPRGVKVNDRVFRTLDSHLMDYAHNFYGEATKKRIPLHVFVQGKIGCPLQITITDDEGNQGRGETDFLAEKAKKYPLDIIVLRKQIDRLGSTEFTLEKLEANFDDDLMVPVSEINEARRRAIDNLTKNRLEKFTPARQALTTISLPSVTDGFSYQTTALVVHCDTLAKVQSALDNGADRIIFGGEAYSTKIITEADYRKVTESVRTAGAELAFATTTVIKEEQLPFWHKLFTLWNELQPDFVYIDNNSLWILAKEFGHLRTWADSRMNIFNSQSLEFWRQSGAAGASVSKELTLQQIGRLCEKKILPIECLVQGRTEMMVSEYCVAGSFLGDADKGECKFQCREPLFLLDRQGAKFPLAMDQYCRMHVLNSVELSMLANVEQLIKIHIAFLRIDGRIYDANTLGKWTNEYKKVMTGKKTVTENFPDTTRGHYFRGVM